MNAVEILPSVYVRMPFRLGVFFRWWNPGSRRPLPDVAARFFRWWIDCPSTRRERAMYREGRAIKRDRHDVNVGLQPLFEVGYGHNPDLPGHRWIEPLPCADDALDSWDDATYLGASWERFVDVDSIDPFRGNGARFARISEDAANEARWGRLR